MKTKQQHWTKTVAAAQAEERSSWSMIWAMAEEAYERDSSYKNISSGAVIEDLRLELEDAGITLSFATIKDRAITGKMAHSATKRDSATLRSVPWSVVLQAARAGAASADVAAFIRSSPSTVTGDMMHERFRRSAPPEVARPAKFSDEHWMSAVATIAAHTMAERRGEYTPGAMARLAGVLLGEMLVGKVAVVDWDAQLSELMDAQDGGG